MYQFKQLIKKDEDFTAAGKQFIFDPYNVANQPITVENVTDIFNMYGLSGMKPCNFNLYHRAFIHESYVHRPFVTDELINNNVIIMASCPEGCVPLSKKSNQRLEFLGDGVLELIAKFYVYSRFHDATEGLMTDIKIELVKNESIGRIAMAMELPKWYILSKHAEAKNARMNVKKLGCLFEALVGAIFLDFSRISIKDDAEWFSAHNLMGPGFQFAAKFVYAVFDKYVDWTAILNECENYKRTLQELTQCEFKTVPVFIQLSTSELTGYHMGVYICFEYKAHEINESNTVPLTNFTSFKDLHWYLAKNHKLVLQLGSAQHKIKQMAEQLACKLSIEYLQTQLKDFADSMAKVSQSK